MITNKFHIIIVGAGMAGLAAAKLLLAHGYKVTVLEGRNRIGGRTYTEHHLGIPFDMGAFVIQGSENNPMTTLVQQSHPPTLLSTGIWSVAFINESNVAAEQIAVFYERYANLLTQARHYAQQQNHDVSLQTALDSVLPSFHFSPLEQKLYRWRSLFQTLYCGADLKDISARHWDEDEIPLGGDYLFLPQGYQPLAEFLAKDIPIELNQTVISIDYDANGCRVQTQQQHYEADAVIITVPLGVLKKQTITFTPTLPQEKQQAIAHLGMGLFNKIALRFPEVFWPPQRIISYFSKQYQQAGWFINYHFSHAQPILAAVMAGDMAKKYEALDDNTLLQTIMAVLKDLFGENIPAPEKYLKTQWGQDPFSAGAYSYIALGATGQDYDVMALPVNNKLFFAGEATHRQCPGTTHGAYFSGVREAERIIALHSL